MTFYERLQSLCKGKGITIYNLEQALGCGSSTIGKYRYGTMPSAKRAQQIADYFSVPVDWLLTGEMHNETDEDAGYYADPVVKELAQFLYQNPKYKVLFDASKNVKPEDILFVKQMIDRITGGNTNDDGGNSNTDS